MGNDLANSIVGGAGNDTLNGGLLKDTLVGGKGDDLYVVEGSSWDTIVELENGGTDTINSKSVNESLVKLTEVENLIFTGNGFFSGTGNARDNFLSGGKEGDSLQGMAGNDTLYRLPVE